MERSSWLELSWTVAAAHRELLEEALEEHDPVCVSLTDENEVTVFEAGDTTPGWERLRVAALFVASVSGEAVRAAITARLGTRVAGARQRLIADRDWVGEWSRGLGPRCFAERLWLVPRSQEPPPGAACIVRLDPGLAFGSGTHATTALCLEWLALQDLRQRDVIDYGCGSGVLGIAALKLGARGVVACDTDPLALQVTRENAVVNEVAPRLQVDRPEAMAGHSCDILLANILLEVLVTHVPVFARHLRPGGVLVLSGVLRSQAEELVDAHRSDFTDFEVQDRDDWIRVVARRRGRG